MKPIFQSCAVALALLVSSCAPQPSGSAREQNLRRTNAISSEADLSKVIARLQQADTRLQAFMDLIEFAGYPTGSIQTDDPILNRMHSMAIRAMHECPNLEGILATLIGRLSDPRYRLGTLSALLKFAGPSLEMSGVTISSGSERLDALLSQTARACRQYADVSTIGQALQQPDWTLRMWAVGNFGNPLGQPQQWRTLLQKMENVASTDDAAIRREAVLRLGLFPGTDTFLQERSNQETSPEILMDLLRAQFVVGDEFKTRFLTRFAPLLSNPDEAVRRDALIFVGSNSRRAEMLQFPFGQNVFDQVIRSTQSRSAKERATAAYALQDLRRLDPNTSQETFVRLASDPDEDVRWRVAGGLAGEFKREDVKQVLSLLLRDKSALVRYMTILAIGPDRFVPQLRELAVGPDFRVAADAKAKLKQIGADR